MAENLDGRQINYLAAATADWLTRDADTAQVKRMLFFVDGLRVSLSTILAERLLFKGPEKKD